MITKLLHQIWNERRENAWLFLELFIVSLFVWLAIDPVFNLVSRNSVHKGYDCTNVYNFYFSEHHHKSPKYKAEYDNNDGIKESYMQMLKLLESLPEIENYYIGHGDGPGEVAKPIYTINTVMRDESEQAESNNVTAAFCHSVEIGNSDDIFKVLRIKDSLKRDVDTSKHKDKDAGAYITKSLARELFGSEEPVGKDIVSVKRYDDYALNEKYTVLGVLDDIQQHLYHDAENVIVITYRLNRFDRYRLGNLSIKFRLKDGVNATSFEKKFREEIMPQLTFGNFYCSHFLSYEQILTDIEHGYGITNAFRQNIVLSSFALLCALLGIVGTFWVRAVARRQEIGIMQSIGATRSAIVRQFAAEALMLTTVAFMLALPLLMHKVYVNGFAEPAAEIIKTPISATAAWRNRPIPHFIIVSVISYLFIAAISIVGAIIPTFATVRKSPADALRDE